MMKKFIYAAITFAPVLALAQTAGTTNIENIVKGIGKIINLIIPIMFALALVYFFWGLIKFIRSAGDPKAAAEGKGIMIYGIIAIAIMISIYGLVNWLATTLGVTQTGNVVLPTVPGI